MAVRVLSILEHGRPRRWNRRLPHWPAHLGVVHGRVRRPHPLPRHAHLVLRPHEGMDEPVQPRGRPVPAMDRTGHCYSRLRGTETPETPAEEGFHS